MSPGTAVFEYGKRGGNSAALWLVTCGGFDGAAAGSRFCPQSRTKSWFSVRIILRKGLLFSSSSSGMEELGLGAGGDKKNGGGGVK